MTEPCLIANEFLRALAVLIAKEVSARLALPQSQSQQARRLLSVDQAAVYLGRTPRAVRHMIQQGALPTVRHDRRVMLDVRDLDQWIEQNKT